MKRMWLMGILLLGGCKADKAPSVVAMDAKSDTSCVASAGTLTLMIELAHRGVVRWGCDDAGSVTARWTPPTEGSPVYYYVVKMETNGMCVDTTCTIPIPVWADSLRGAVAGVDSLGRQGPWSEWSLWYPVQH